MKHYNGSRSSSIRWLYFEIYNKVLSLILHYVPFVDLQDPPQILVLTLNLFVDFFWLLSYIRPYFWFCSGITPGSAPRPYAVPRIEARPAAYKTTVLPLHISVGPESYLDYTSSPGSTAISRFPTLPLASAMSKAEGQDTQSSHN